MENHSFQRKALAPWWCSVCGKRAGDPVHIRATSRLTTATYRPGYEPDDDAPSTGWVESDPSPMLPTYSASYQNESYHAQPHVSHETSSHAPSIGHVIDTQAHQATHSYHDSTPSVSTDSGSSGSTDSGSSGGSGDSGFTAG